MAEQPRGELREYIGKPGTDGSPPAVFTRLAKGFTTMSGAMNPQVLTITYIDDYSSTTTTGFEPEWSIDGNIYTGDPVNDMLHEMTWEMAKGDDAILYLLRVMMWHDGEEPDSYKAKRHRCNWAPDSDGGGAGGENNTFSGTLQAKGHPSFGSAKITLDTGVVPHVETAVFIPGAGEHV